MKLEIPYLRINNTPGRRTDFIVTHVVEWGYRHGGYTQEENFYVRVAEGDLPLTETLVSSGFDNGNA